MDAKTFQKIRWKMRLTQGEFAKLLGISESSVQAIEQGRRPVSGKVRAVIADHIDSEELIIFLDSYDKIGKIYPI